MKIYVAFHPITVPTLRLLVEKPLMGNRATNFLFHFKKMPKPLSIFFPNLFLKHSPIKSVTAILMVTYTFVNPGRASRHLDDPTTKSRC